MPGPATPEETARRLDRGWELASAPADLHPGPGALGELEWTAARVPGTVAGALGRERIGTAGAERDLDAEDWWFRTRFEAAPAEPGERVELRLDGLATVAEVHLNGELILASESMFVAHRVDVGDRLRGANELAIRFRALGPLLEPRRKPRARWRTRLVSEGNLRFFRTMLIGRTPGIAPGPAAVGPWRPIALVRRSGIGVEDVRPRARLEGEDGILTLAARVLGLEAGEELAGEIELDGPSGEHRAALRPSPSPSPDGSVPVEGELRIPRVARWWPHTHGEPALHDVRVRVRCGKRERLIDAGRVGFRSISPGPSLAHDATGDGLDLHVNGVRTFARGAVWTPVDPIGMAPESGELRAALEAVRDAGMNMIRIAGTGAYESDELHDLCDELGLLVWQDFMFANLDYPIADEGFRAQVEAESRQLLDRLAPRPSLAVLCGNSEVSQQVAMLGLDPELGLGELFGELLPDLIGEAGADAVYVPSAPSGGALPFRTDRGVSNYFGVGGYRRPLADARRAEVRFASECLALSNVPAESTVASMIAGSATGPVVHEPAWKAGVPRDAGVGWDFEDVRDHYLRELFGVDPVELRSVDHGRYLELSRAVSGEVMAETFGEWRRRASPCGGGLILWLRDLVPGAGWGVIDSRGLPKVAYHHLRRALAPVAVWTTDEGMNGIAAHVANDGAEPLRARLRVTVYRNLSQPLEEATEELELAPRETLERDVEAVIGRFVDASCAYRFGPPAHDAVVASLERDGPSGSPELLSQSFRFPAGRPLSRSSSEALGIAASLRPSPDGEIEVAISTRTLAYGVRLHAPGYASSDDAFSIEPGGERVIGLRPLDGADPGGRITVSALNLDGTIRMADAS